MAHEMVVVGQDRVKVEVSRSLRASFFIVRHKQSSTHPSSTTTDSSKEYVGEAAASRFVRHRISQPVYRGWYCPRRGQGEPRGCWYIYVSSLSRFIPYSHQSPSSPVQCIAEAFGVDPTDQAQVDRLSVKPTTLQSIFDVFLKTKDKISSTAQAASSASPTTPVPPPAEDKAAADKLKQEGNAQMSSKQYDKAIDAYTEAIKRNPSNPVYYSNRAAAHSSKGDHLTAAVDAEKAIELDPKFVKGYSRLGYWAAGFPIGISLLTSLRTDTLATASVTTLRLRLRTVMASN